MTYFPLQEGNKVNNGYIKCGFLFALLLRKLQECAWRSLQRCKRLIKETFSWNRWNTYFHSCTRRHVQVLCNTKCWEKHMSKCHNINNHITYMYEVCAVIIFKIYFLNFISGDLWWKLDALILIFPRWSLIVMVGLCHWTAL